MKKKFDTRAAAHGGAGIMFSVTFVLVGIIILFKLEEYREVWGGMLILCGISFYLGMMYFGLKTEINNNGNELK